MAIPIIPITPISPVISASTIAAPALPKIGGVKDPFSALFSNAVASVEVFQNNATASAARFMNGEGEELHRVTLAAQQAEMSFELFLQARNKVVAAYQEIMRMQI